MSNFDDLQLMTTHANRLAALLEDSLNAIEAMLNYPEAEYASKAKGESVIRLARSWREQRKRDDAFDQRNDVLSNEYVRVKRLQDASNAMTPEQKAILGFKG